MEQYTISTTHLVHLL